MHLQYTKDYHKIMTHPSSGKFKNKIYLKKIRRNISLEINDCCKHCNFFYQKYVKLFNKISFSFGHFPISVLKK